MINLHSAENKDLEDQERKMENTQIMMEEKLGFIEVLKEAFTIPYKNPNFIIFTFLTSLPLFCFMLIYEIIFQQTLITTAKILSEAPPFTCYNCFDGTPLGFIERLIKEVSYKFLLLVLFYWGILYFLDLINTIATVDSASVIYAGERTTSLKNMLQRFIKETRFKGPLITSIYALLLSYLILSGLLSLAIYIYIAPEYAFLMVLFGVLFIALLAKYLEWSSIWNMGTVISVLEEKQGDVALFVSSYLSRGSRQSGLLFVLVFFMWSLALRLSCFYLGWNEGGSGIVVTAVHISLVCLGNVMKWVVFVVYFYDCKKRSREKKILVEESKVVEA